ncbi:hypothetical protein P43SY_010188 [Pythium insidiosum]|uniref:Serine hydrolase domain-containing protein n=1 Tax=Pythium insidiosum TaxID=114742 RepID=A0AAD5Q9U7_PYTIN|nr:hypothetical protein P43SY_010188 [Pythium insidiosum]
MSKLRVLCLHGYRQNGEKLRGRISAFRRTFKSYVEFVCIDAPIEVPYEPTTERGEQSDDGESQEDVRQFSWWDYHIDEATGDHTYSKVNESIAYLEKVYKEQGPFDGIFGFSQGGMMASLLFQLQQTKPNEVPFGFRFGIFVSATTPRDSRYDFTQETLKFPSVHMMGTTDAVVPVERSRQLAERFENPIVFEHSGGHYIPANKDPKDILRSFLRDMEAAMLYEHGAKQ